MQNYRLTLLFSCLLASLPLSCAAADTVAHPFSIGMITGYGNTDWDRLVSNDTDSSVTTPTKASGSGAIIGAQLAYDITPYFGLEGQYIRYPDASVDFTPYAAALFYDKQEHITSKTNYFAVLAKVSAPFLNDHYTVFGTLGAARVTRYDVLTTISNYRPTFGFGVSNVQLEHWVFSLAFNYTPGTGTASMNTSDQYIPYLYSGQISVSYRI
jgi:hypothetical protein